MGIYLFAPEVLAELLASDPDATDFGREVIPGSIGTHRVTSYPFSGYWADIGTISNFFEANLDLATSNPEFDMYVDFSPLFTRARALPGARIDRCDIENSIICDACDLHGATIRRSIIGIRGRIRSGSRLEETVVMGADYWEGHYRDPGRSDDSLPAMGIGRDCVIRRAIIDKNARIGDGAKLLNERGTKDADGEGYFIRDGIIVVPKNGIIFPGLTV
jgi:glucose-1-phosphate adenylyltransferase